jgi:probable addiction module antidote protein
VKDDRLKTTVWDSAEYLLSPKDVAEYLEVALEEGDAAEVAHALGVISRSKGMAEIAGQTGLGRESLYKSLSATGNPELATFLKVVRALGLKLRVAA